MNTNDFLMCTFQGDDKKYVAEITQVQNGHFNCRFVHSGKEYKFDSHSFSVLETNGGFPKGTPLTFYQLFTPNSAALTPMCFVVVTFFDNNRYLGVLNYLQPDRNVTFLHSGSMYTFNQDNVIVAKVMGAYNVGQKIKGIELYKPGTEVQLSEPSIFTTLLQRMNAIKTIVPTGEGEITYVDGKVLGSVLMSNFDVNSSTLKVEYHKGLEQLSNALNSSNDSKIIIVGRASQTGSENWNESLSEQRGLSVRNYLTGVNHVDNRKVIDVIGVGSEFPLKDNRGIEEQINRSVQIFFYIPMVIPPPTPPKPKPQDIGSTEWEIQLLPDITVGAGIAGTFLTGKIRNRATGEVKSGAFVGGGIGASLKYMPVTGGVSDDWISFSTDAHYTWDDFENTLCRYTTVGAGFLVGYSLSYISFPLLGANSIDVGGFELGSFGAGGTTTAGVWKFI